METKQRTNFGARSTKRTQTRRVPTLSNVDRELEQSIAVLQRNAAFVKSVDGKPTKVSDTTLYINADASGFSGIQPIMDSNTKRLVGLTNFDGNKLNSGKAFVISAIRLSYSTNGNGVEDADWQNEDRLPSELQNAEVVMSQNGMPILSMPLSDLQGFKFDDYRRIADKPIILPNEPISIDIHFPSGVQVPVKKAKTTTLPAIEQFIRLEFRGTKSKS